MLNNYAILGSCPKYRQSATSESRSKRMEGPKMLGEPSQRFLCRSEIPANSANDITLKAPRT
jgi:hypothetical protein